MVYCEVEAIGTVVTRGTSSVTNLIKIVRIIPFEEFEQLINGKTRSDGITIYYKNGLFNDPDLNTPAIKYSNGSYHHYFNGVSHRESENPTYCEIDDDGTKSEGYCVNGVVYYCTTHWNYKGEEVAKQKYRDELKKFKDEGSKFRFGQSTYFYDEGYDEVEIEYLESLREQ
jgi:hypothetical protein